MCGCLCGVILFSIRVVLVHQPFLIKCVLIKFVLIKLVKGRLGLQVQAVAYSGTWWYFKLNFWLLRTFNTQFVAPLTVGIIHSSALGVSSVVPHQGCNQIPPPCVWEFV